MLRLHQVYRTNRIARQLLNDQKNKLNLTPNEYDEIIQKNNSKLCRNKYKSIPNLHSIIFSSILKAYTNVYFYKNVLKIAENRKNNLNLHQINTILKSVIRAKIFRYSLFHAFEEPILKYVTRINGLINREIDKVGKGNNLHNGNSFYDKKKFLPTIGRTWKKLYISGGRNKSGHWEEDLNVNIISDHINILCDIYKSYTYIVNFRFSYLCETLFFFITKNHLYLNENKKEILKNLWTIYLSTIWDKDDYTFGVKTLIPRDVYIHQDITPRRSITHLYRHKYKCNIHLRMVGNYTTVFKNGRIKHSRGKKTSYRYKTIFCKNNSFSICKYVVMIILKKHKLGENYKKKKKKIKNKNMYISYGYMYKLKNEDITMSYSQMKYIIKNIYVDNFAFLRENYFPKEPPNRSYLLQNVFTAMSNVNIQSAIFCRYLCENCISQFGGGGGGVGKVVQ
ncbi:conserved Plasmodium protein, unknown function [Plasmodium ovale curtisi]|uniref:Uncharacterized protein n=1 Tax=Plasmodium ovale curtisi TaxID=864141 RepID=A0A1A8X125_PLAOA|nr:conserved Plasmodium protein, unknown function [Plasmodium ovale curtisi]SBS97381.1 conserved Plasmodium protein, unknown function [Plasmodium ovale curtisi]